MKNFKAFFTLPQLVTVCCLHDICFCMQKMASHAMLKLKLICRCHTKLKRLSFDTPPASCPLCQYSYPKDLFWPQIIMWWVRTSNGSAMKTLNYTDGHTQTHRTDRFYTLDCWRRRERWFRTTFNCGGGYTRNNFRNHFRIPNFLLVHGRQRF